MGFFDKLKQSLGKTKEAINEQVNNVFKVFVKIDEEFFEELVKHHISGQLRVAPEHICDSVLQLMGKPGNAVYISFIKRYDRINAGTGKQQYIVPYLMSSHPGSGLKEAVALAEYIRDLGYMPEQVQDFYPTPSTVSTCMYYTGIDPRCV